MKTLFTAFLLFPFLFSTAQLSQSKIDKLKQEVAVEVEKNAALGQQINDMLFSFSELGFQEVETFAYLTNLLEKNGFTIEKGVAGIPTAWIAKWGSGKPVIALGSDVDCIPKASQKPGVAYHDPIVEGAPGHGDKYHFCPCLKKGYGARKNIWYAHVVAWNC
jgi:aminobenzoyl-glutamate utilization protein B